MAWDCLQSSIQGQSHRRKKNNLDATRLIESDRTERNSPGAHDAYGMPKANRAIEVGSSQTCYRRARH
jgi:hypothetical protein